MDRSRRHAIWRALCAAMTVCVVAAAPARAVTLILKSSTLPAYDATALGCRTTLRSPSVEVSMDEGSPADVHRRIAAVRADVVVAIGTRAAEYARAHLPRTPIVFCLVQDPDKHGLVGKGVTGITYAVGPHSELAALKRTAPTVRRVALVHSAAVTASFVRSAFAAATDVGLRLVDCAVTDETDMSRQMLACINTVDAVWLPPDPTLSQPEPFRFLVQLCVDAHKPLLVFSESLVRGGALMAVAPDYFAVGAQASEAVRRVQAGDAVDSIPIAPARKTRVVYNESTGRAIGIAETPHLLQAEIVK